MRRTKIILAMDFDGVIADSILECAVSGINGFAMFNNNTELITDYHEIKSDILTIFRNTRPYIRSGEDYVYLFQAINDNVNIETQADFDSFKHRFNKNQVSYRSYFNMAREWLIMNHPNEWLGLNPLYNNMDIFLNSLNTDFYIVSTKPKKYIIEILSHNHVQFIDRNIYSTEMGMSKSNIIKKIIYENNSAPSNMYYIDDHFNTLETIVDEIEVNCLLALWGYNKNENRLKGQSISIENIKLEKFYANFG